MKKMKWFIILIIGSLVVFVNLDIQAQSDASSGIIKGSVTDLLKGEPIVKAKVEVYKHDVEFADDGLPILNSTKNSTLLATIYTDKLGAFSFEVPLRWETDYFNVRVSSGSKESVTKNIVKVSVEKPAQIQFRLIPAVPTSKEDKLIEEKLKTQILEKDAAKFEDLGVRSKEVKKNHFGNDSGVSPLSHSALGGGCTYSSVPTNVYVSNLINGYNAYSSGSGYTGYINFDDYIAGVVQGEIGGITINIETKKAQAVAARTFSMNRHLNGWSVNIGQAYNDSPGTSSQNSSSQTTTQIILYNGSVADARYSARCNGDYTQNFYEGTWTPYSNCNFTGGAVPYMVSRPCSGHISCGQTSEIPCCNVTISTSGVSGYIYGHGVGLCQRGIEQWGEIYNWNYCDILNQYYTDICIANSSCSNTGCQPDNDDCSSATSITPNGACESGDVVCATASGFTQASCDLYSSGTPHLQDVWYTFTATTSGTYTITVTPNSSSTDISNLDAVLALYSGTCGSLSPVANGCADSGGGSGTSETVSVSLSAGTYWIRVYDYGSQSVTTGGFSVCIASSGGCTEPDAPTNLSPGTISYGNPAVINSTSPTLDWSNVTGTNICYNLILFDFTTSTTVLNEMCVCSGSQYQSPSLINGHMYGWTLSANAGGDCSGNCESGITDWYYFEVDECPNPSEPADEIIASVNPSCSGYNTTLTVSGGSLGTGGQWVWYEGGCAVGSPIGYGMNRNVSPTITTIYSVLAEDDCGTTGCASIQIEVFPQIGPLTVDPEPTVTICPNETLQITASCPGATEFQWEASPYLTDFGGGIAEVSPISNTTFTVFASNGGCETSLAFAVWVSPGATVPSISHFNGGNELVSTSAASYQWLDANQLPISGETNSLFCPPTQGTYYVQVVSNSCEVISAPFISQLPQLSLNGNMIECDQLYGTFDWYLNGNLVVSGGNLNEIDYTNYGPGDYRVCTTDPDECFACSQIIMVPTVGIEESSEDIFIMIPNPNNGRFDLVLPKLFEADSYQVFDNIGQVVKQGSITSERTQIDMSGFAEGVYTLRLSEGNESLGVERVVLMKN